LFKDRVVLAIRSMREQYIAWPNADERKSIAKRFQDKYRFPKCIGIIDGTLTPLAFPPSTEDAADYHGRKTGHGLSSLILCDDKRMIRYYVTGWPASAHDNRIFRNCTLYQDPGAFFSPGQYILGDSAFQNMPFMVSAYKKPYQSRLSRRNERFNKRLSKARVHSEHCIGMLKGRFPFLRQIRMRINEATKKENMRKILKMIDVTIILHNFLLLEQDDVLEAWMNEGDVEDDEDETADMDDGTPILDGNVPSDLRRRQVQAYVAEYESSSSDDDSSD
jgi:hypothetical protein